MESLSPLRIGGGNENSDSDILLDGRGLPFIPGSSIAGVIRNLMLDTVLEEKYSNDTDLIITEEDITALFGDVDTAKSTSDIPKAFASKILFSDGVMDNDGHDSYIYISTRDGVGLDEWGMAIKHEKYDFEIVEFSKPLIAIIECNFDNDIYMKKFERVLSIVQNEGLMLGARTSRGYGKMKCELSKTSFSFPNDISTWLDFDPYKDNDNYKLCEFEGERSRNTTIEINFRLLGDLIIKVKEANAVVREDDTNPDDVTIKNYKGEPVIPGTSWAGCFRHHMMDVNRELNIVENWKDIDCIFGKDNDENRNTKSKLYFSESVIIGGEPVVTVRNSVDRFTAGPTNGALFTNESWHGGTTTLYISFRNDVLEDSIKTLLIACIYDLSNGLMSIGGNASVGKGIVNINKILINGEDNTKELLEYNLSL